MKARLAKGPDWDMTSAWLAGGKVWKSSSLTDALQIFSHDMQLYEFCFVVSIICCV